MSWYTAKYMPMLLLKIGDYILQNIFCYTNLILKLVFTLAKSV